MRYDSKDYTYAIPEALDLLFLLFYTIYESLGRGAMVSQELLPRLVNLFEKRIRRRIAVIPIDRTPTCRFGLYVRVKVSLESSELSFAFLYPLGYDPQRLEHGEIKPGSLKRAVEHHCGTVSLWVEQVVDLEILDGHLIRVN